MLFGRNARGTGISFGFATFVLLVFSVTFNNPGNLLVVIVAAIGAVFLTMALLRAAEFMYQLPIPVFLFGSTIYWLAKDDILWFMTSLTLSVILGLIAYFEFRKFIAKRSSK